MASSYVANNIYGVLEEEAPGVGMPVNPEEVDNKPKVIRDRPNAHTRRSDTARAQQIRPGKREFDHSGGAGLMKKGGHGKHNWGSNLDEVKNSVRDMRLEAAGVTEQTQQPAEEPAQESQADQTPVKTFDDYVVELAKKRVQGEENKKERAVIQDKKFQNAEVFKKSQEDNPFSDVVKQKNAKKKERDQKKKVISIDEFNATVAPASNADDEEPQEEQAPRNERGRGRGGFGRGGPRGGFGRGGPRGGFGRGGPRGGFGRGDRDDAGRAEQGDAPQGDDQRQRFDGQRFDGQRGGRGRGGFGRGGPRGGFGRGGPRGGRGGSRANIDITNEASFPSLSK